MSSKVKKETQVKIQTDIFVCRNVNTEKPLEQVVDHDHALAIFYFYSC